MSGTISMAPLYFFFFLLVAANEGSSIKPFVSIDPNWATIFTKESVTLTCNVDPPGPKDQIYYWYRDNQIVPMYLGTNIVKIDRASKEHGGSYQCQTVTSDKSDPVRLQVTSSWLTLKVPGILFEGDELSVACAGYPGYSARDAMLYRGNEVIASSPSEADFLVGTANMAMSGSYRCTRQVKDGVIYYSYSSEEIISVKELFSKPVMKVNPNHLTEGDHVTITCDTELSPRRATTELQFAFYRNGHNVQGFSSVNTFHVPSMLLQNSGNYACEVRTRNDTVRKRSDEIKVAAGDFPYFVPTGASLDSSTDEGRDVGQMPVVPGAERSYAPMAVEVTMAVLISSLAVALLVYVFKRKLSPYFFNHHTGPASSASVKASENRKDMSSRYTDLTVV